MQEFSQVRWGILGAARIADGAVIPGMMKSRHATAQAIGARDLTRVRTVAEFVQELVRLEHGIFL